MASKSRAASTAFKRSKKQADGESRASWCRPSRSLRRCPRNISRKVGRRHASDHLTQYPKELSVSKTAITAPELSPPVGPFSQAVKDDGFLFFSGQVAQDPATGKVVEGGIVAETERVFQN